MSSILTEREGGDIIVRHYRGHIFYFIRRFYFNSPVSKRELARQEMNDIAMFGKVSESTIPRKIYRRFNYGTRNLGNHR
jgi:hypothetical protein